MRGGLEAALGEDGLDVVEGEGADEAAFGAEEGAVDGELLFVAAAVLADFTAGFTLEGGGDRRRSVIV